jgi:hypothetical protein
MAKLITPEESVKRMIEGAGNAAGRWEQGIQNPRKDFKTAAIAAKDKYVKRTQEALADDRWAKGMGQVDSSAAIATALARGGGSISEGMRARQPKILRRVTKYFGLLAPHIDAMDRLPTTSAADADNKMLANVRGMRDIGKKMRE